MPYLRGEVISDEDLQSRLANYRQSYSGPGHAPEDDQTIIDFWEGRRDDPAGGGGGSTSQQSSNPEQQGKLDDLLEQMISNQKQYADQAAARDASQRQWADQWRGNIMSQYNQLQGPVNENDPRIAHQRQVYDAAQQRARNQAQEAMAARGATTGTPQGASDAWLQSSYENQGRNLAGYSAGLVGDEYTRRRDEIQKLLGLGAGVLTADENRMLQDRMGTINSTIDNLRAQNQYSLDLGNQSLGWGQLGQQNRHFYDQMGWNTGMQEALMNQQIMRELGGGA